MPALHYASLLLSNVYMMTCKAKQIGNAHVAMRNLSSKQRYGIAGSEDASTSLYAIAVRRSVSVMLRRSATC